MATHPDVSPALIALLEASGMSPSAIEDFLARYDDPLRSGLDRRNGAGGGSSSGETESSGPPYMSFNPALEAEQRALERGLEDLLHDTRLERRYANQDTTQTLEDLAQDKRRGITDIRQQRHRGLKDIAEDRERGIRDIGTRRSTVQRDAARGREDFSTRLGNLIHRFQVEGTQQTERANAQGVLDESTKAASSAARAGNFARARQPLDTSLARLNEDEQSSLTRLGTAESDLFSDTAQAESRLRHDTHQTAHRLRQDVTHDEELAEQQLARQLRDIRIRRQRARREERIGQADLTEQQIYEARQNQPGAFDTQGNRRNKNRRDR